MQRRAFKMHLHPGQAAEYRRRHDEIWPELAELLKSAGVHDYSIFLDEETHTLFGVLKAADPEALDALPAQAVMRRWWAYMRDIMDSHPDDSPVSTPLREVFHLP
jgi:L-rhamnose mutarotase